MPYIRPTPKCRLEKPEKVRIVKAMVEHHRQAFTKDPDSLNRKVPRNAFADLLEDVGVLLLSRSEALARETGPVRSFLDETPLPAELDGLLPPEYRTFCLALNALKQWVAKEQAATDRYLLGGTARETCRAAATTCIVTGKPLAGETAVLHHPLRDGRPPLPLSEEGHAMIEGQARREGGGATTVGGKMKAMKKQMNRSWIHLKRGCQDHLGRAVEHSGPKMASNARSFAKTVSVETGLGYEEILDWLSENTDVDDR